MTYQWSPAETIDQEPGDERCDEIPRLQTTRHKGRGMFVEAETVLEERWRVICSWGQVNNHVPVSHLMSPNHDRLGRLNTTHK